MSCPGMERVKGRQKSPWEVLTESELSGHERVKGRQKSPREVLTESELSGHGAGERQTEESLGGTDRE